MIKNYRILESEDSRELEREVLEFLREGWILHGPPMIYKKVKNTPKFTSTHFVQVMIKKKGRWR